MPLPHSFKKTKITSKRPLVSVIIPTYNEKDDLPACLASLKKQTYTPIEVLVVDDGSTDETVALAKKSQCKVLRQKHQGPGAARNFGARKARGEILVLIDADMELPPEYVEKLTKPIRENTALGTIEALQYNVHTTKMQACWGSVVRTKQLEGINSATVRGIARKDFLALGGFDKKYGYADDRTFFLTYGIRFTILPDVACYHKTPATFTGVFKQSRWIGSSLEKGLLQYKWIRGCTPVLMIFALPVALPVLTIKKLIEVKKPLLLPWMIIFMLARYTGTLAGIARRVYYRDNTR